MVCAKLELFFNVLNWLKPLTICNGSLIRLSYCTVFAVFLRMLLCRVAVISDPLGDTFGFSCLEPRGESSAKETLVLLRTIGCKCYELTPMTPTVTFIESIRDLRECLLLSTISYSNSWLFCLSFVVDARRSLGPVLSKNGFIAWILPGFYFLSTTVLVRFLYLRE